MPPPDSDVLGPLRLTGPQPSEHPGPLHRIAGSNHANFQEAVVRAGVGEGLKSSCQSAHVAEQKAAAPALEPPAPVDLDRHLDRPGPDRLGPGPYVRQLA